MKRLLCALSIISTLQIFAQDPILYDHTWYLHDLIIDGISRPFPPEPGGVQLIFDEDLPFDFNFQSLVCKEGISEITYDNPNSSFTFVRPLEVDGLVCLDESWIIYEQLYFDFFRDELSEPFVYNISSSGGAFTLVITSDSGNQAIYGDQILSVSEQEIPKINVSPNPVSDVLYLSSRKLDILSMTLYTLEGRQVDLSTEVSSGVNHEISVSHLTSGMYFLQLQTEKGVVVKRFVKE